MQRPQVSVIGTGRAFRAFFCCRVAAAGSAFGGGGGGSCGPIFRRCVAVVGRIGASRRRFFCWRIDSSCALFFCGHFAVVGRIGGSCSGVFYRRGRSSSVLIRSLADCCAIHSLPKACPITNENLCFCSLPLELPLQLAVCGFLMQGRNPLGSSYVLV